MRHHPIPITPGKNTYSQEPGFHVDGAPNHEASSSCLSGFEQKILAVSLDRYHLKSLQFYAL